MDAGRRTMSALKTSEGGKSSRPKVKSQEGAQLLRAVRAATQRGAVLVVGGGQGVVVDDQPAAKRARR